MYRRACFYTVFVAHDAFEDVVKIAILYSPAISRISAVLICGTTILDVANILSINVVARFSLDWTFLLMLIAVDCIAVHQKLLKNLCRRVAMKKSPPYFLDLSVLKWTKIN